MLLYCISFSEQICLIVIFKLLLFFNSASNLNNFPFPLLLLFQVERKKYEKETEKYYSSLEKLLNMSARKKEPQLQEVFIILVWTLTDM